MEEWHKITAGDKQWPREGTFNMALCDEIEANIKYYKAKDKQQQGRKESNRKRDIEMV